MRWEDERWVKLYVRDTTTWKLLPWQSRALLTLLLRKADRAGVLELSGESPEDVVSAHVEVPVDFVRQGLPELVRRDVVRIGTLAIVLPNYIAAQEANASDKARQQKARETARDIANKQAIELQEALRIGTSVSDKTVTQRDDVSQNVTDGHNALQNVTGCHALSRAVTPRVEVTRVEETRRSSVVSDETNGGKPKSRKPKVAPDPRLKKLTDDLVADYLELVGEKYPHQGGSDGQALKALLGSFTPEQIRAKWRTGIQASGFKRTGNFAELRRKWPHLNGDAELFDESGAPEYFSNGDDT